MRMYVYNGECKLKLRKWKSKNLPAKIFMISKMNVFANKTNMTMTIISIIIWINECKCINNELKNVMYSSGKKKKIEFVDNLI